MMISVITATYNAATVLPALIASLQAQTDQDFEWVVVDGKSSDNTVDIVKDLALTNVVLSSEGDFGVYDAINRGLILCSGEYYLVVGADDVLELNAIEAYKRAVQETSADIVTASIYYDGRVVKARNKYPWLYGQSAYVSAHSVGSLIKKSLHDKYGLYSNRFPIAADQYFLKNVCMDGVVVCCSGFVAGTFNQGGVSTNDVIGSMTEFFRVQLETENKFLQILIFIIRLIRHAGKL